MGSGGGGLFGGLIPGIPGLGGSSIPGLGGDGSSGIPGMGGDGGGLINTVLGGGDGSSPFTGMMDFAGGGDMPSVDQSGNVTSPGQNLGNQIQDSGTSQVASNQGQAQQTQSPAVTGGNMNLNDVLRSVFGQSPSGPTGFTQTAQPLSGGLPFGVTNPGATGQPLGAGQAQSFANRFNAAIAPNATAPQPSVDELLAQPQQQPDELQQAYANEPNLLKQPAATPPAATTTTPTPPASTTPTPPATSTPAAPSPSTTAPTAAPAGTPAQIAENIMRSLGPGIPQLAKILGVGIDGLMNALPSLLHSLGLPQPIINEIMKALGQRGMPAIMGGQPAQTPDQQTAANQSTEPSPGMISPPTTGDAMRTGLPSGMGNIDPNMVTRPPMPRARPYTGNLPLQSQGERLFGGIESDNRNLGFQGRWPNTIGGEYQQSYGFQRQYGGYHGAPYAAYRNNPLYQRQVLHNFVGQALQNNPNITMGDLYANYHNNTGIAGNPRIHFNQMPRSVQSRVIKLARQQGINLSAPASQYFGEATGAVAGVGTPL